VAGIPIQIDVLEQKGAAGWSARIGCHSDDLGVYFILVIKIKKYFFENRIVMNFVDGHVFRYVNHYLIKEFK
jgi:hypothetical protein